MSFVRGPMSDVRGLANADLREFPKRNQDHRPRDIGHRTSDIGPSGGAAQ